MSAAANTWNGLRPIASPNESQLSGRAHTVYGWLAGLYAFCVPWSDIILLPYQVQFSRPLAILAVLCLLISWRAGNTLRRTGFPIGAMALFIMLVPIHLLSANDPERSGRRLVSYLGLFFMALFLQQCVRGWRTHIALLKSFIAGCTVLAGNLVLNVVNGRVQGDGRYTGYGFDPNDLAGQIALSIPVAAYLAFTLKRGAIWFRLYLPLAVLCILLTASRAGLVVMLFALLYPLSCFLRRMKRGRIGLIAVAVVTGWAIQYFAPNISFHRLSTLGEQIASGDMNGRGAIWTYGLQLYWDNPVFGIGAGAFTGAMRGGVRTAAHNSYLEVLVEHGAVGLTLFLAIILGLFARARRYPLEERLLWFTVLAAWMILVFTLSWENREFTWLIWGLCASFVPRETSLSGVRYYAS